MISASVTGLGDVLKRLRAADAKVKKKALRKGMTAAAKPVLQAAKALVPVRTGAAKKSLGTKVVVYGGTAVAIVGPRSGHFDAGAKKFVAKKTGRARRKYQGVSGAPKPVFYWHLFERGTRRSKATPTLAPALEATRGAAEQALAAVLRAEIEG